MYHKLRNLLGLLTVFTLVITATPAQRAYAAGEPVAPTNLVASASYPGDLAISITWDDNSADETAFEIERCSGTGCTDFTLLATRYSNIWGPWYTDVGLGEVTSYTYRVRAINSFGASAYSNETSAATSYEQPNGQVYTISGSFTNGVVTLNWQENATNETRLEVERYEVGGGETGFSVIASVEPDTTSYVDSTALQGTSYTYRVVPWRYDIFGGAPETVTVETGAGIAGPESFKANAGAPGTARLSWRGKFTAGETLIVVQRLNCELYGCYGWSTLAQVDASTGRFIDTGLMSGTGYTYRIRAITTTSVSPFTGEVAVVVR